MRKKKMVNNNNNETTVDKMKVRIATAVLVKTKVIC